MFSIVCCYNDKKILENFLLSSLNKQAKDYQLLLVDNTNNSFSSVAKAYNSVLSEINGDNVLFCHQDFAFKESNQLEEFEAILNNHKKAVIGLCGIDNNGKVYSNLLIKGKDEYITRNRVEEMMPVESVDECCFGMSKEWLDGNGKFDEVVCDSWHLYATDYCFRTKLNGGEVLLLPDEGYHKDVKADRSEVTKEYLASLKKLRKKFKQDYKTIYSPCYIASTNAFKFNLKTLKTKIRIFCKK